MDENLKGYVERFCKTYDMTPEEAVQEKLVQHVKEYYEELKEDTL